MSDMVSILRRLTESSSELLAKLENSVHYSEFEAEIDSLCDIVDEAELVLIDKGE